MIQRALGVIAGVDRKTLSTCPASDKLWATHLGASLCLSFVVVLGVSFHATGYMIASVSTRLLVSGVIALTVLMFDRALCQSDWFYQGTLWNTAPIQSGAEARQTAWRFVRVGIRLLMSFGLAWVIAMFLELAIFSGTINEKIEADRVAANQPIYAKVAQFEAGLNAEAARRQAGIDALEALYRDALTEAPAPEPNLQARNDDIEQQTKALVAREADIRASIAEIDRTIQRYIADMNAEEFGQKAAPNNSGRPGAGPRYEFAKKQKDAFIAQRAAREGEIVQLRMKRDELRAAQTALTAEALAARDQERLAIKAKADALQARIDAARADLKSFETAKIASLAEFRSKALGESYFQEKKDRIDPLARIAAYQELKNDPKDGGTMTLFSWMTRFFIIFLEIVPVVAKIFFSPPSVYAAKIQAQVERARQRIENNEDLDDDKPAVPAPAPAIAAITLPTMSLGAVEMRHAPANSERRRNEPQRAPAHARDHDRAIYGRDYHRRDHYGHAYEDDNGYDRRDDRRPEFDERHDSWRDSNWRNFDRRDQRIRDDEMPRPTPRTRASQFAMHNEPAPDAAVPSYKPAFEASEIDVRDLIMPRGRASVRPEPIRRTRVPLTDQAPATPDPATRSASKAENNVRRPSDPGVDEEHSRELLRQVLAAAENATPADPAREAIADTPRSPMPHPTPALDGAAAQPADGDTLAQPDVVPTSLEVKDACAEAEAAPSSPAVAETNAAPSPDFIGPPTGRYTADVAKLMTEAVELSRTMKKTAPARPEHHHAGGPASPISNAVQYEIFPKS